MRNKCCAAEERERGKRDSLIRAPVARAKVPIFLYPHYCLSQPGLASLCLTLSHTRLRSDVLNNLYDARNDLFAYRLILAWLAAPKTCSQYNLIAFLFYRAG